MALQIITWLLFFALIYLLVTSVVFLRNRIELTSLAPQNPSDHISKISVCIPARNEHNSLGNLLGAIEDQTYPQYEVHILDDQSSDNTFDIARFYQQKDPDRFFVHKGENKPDDWLGKPWACHQLSKKCDGEILIFLDADTELKPETLSRINASFQKYDLDMLTVWPVQKLVTFWERVVVPIVYYFLVTHLPAIYVYRDPRWMPSFLQKYFRPVFAAACGQCLAFKREAYLAAGGHGSVKNEVVEDVKLARQIKKSGFVLRMFDGVGSISCRMYGSEKEMFEGFRKNFLAGFHHSIPAFTLAGLLHLIVFVLPFVTLFISFFNFDGTIFFLSVASISLVLIQRLILAIWYRLDPVYSFTHPLGVLWFQRLATVTIRDYFWEKPALWKGREV